jgi:hypothetical protein
MVMDVHAWRHPDPTAVTWLAWLASTGYGLSEVEDRVVAAVLGRDDPAPHGEGQGDTATDTATEGDAGA